MTKSKSVTRDRDHAIVKHRVIERLGFASRICREEFLSKGRTQRQERREFRILNAVFQELVADGVLFTVDRGGDYTFFQHHGRAFPKMWDRRRCV